MSKNKKKHILSVHIFGLIVDKRHELSKSLFNDIFTTEINCQVNASEIELFDHHWQPRALIVFNGLINNTDSFKNSFIISNSIGYSI